MNENILKGVENCRRNEKDILKPLKIRSSALKKSPAPTIKITSTPSAFPSNAFDLRFGERIHLRRCFNTFFAVQQSFNRKNLDFRIILVVPEFGFASSCLFYSLASNHKSRTRKL